MLVNDNHWWRSSRKPANLLPMSIPISVLTLLFGSVLFSSAAESLLATIPVKHQHNRILLTAKINDKGPFSLLLDTGCTVPTLHPTLVDDGHRLVPLVGDVLDADTLEARHPALVEHSLHRHDGFHLG